MCKKFVLSFLFALFCYANISLAMNNSFYFYRGFYYNSTNNRAFAKDSFNDQGQRHINFILDDGGNNILHQAVFNDNAELVLALCNIPEFSILLSMENDFRQTPEVLAWKFKRSENIKSILMQATSHYGSLNTPKVILQTNKPANNYPPSWSEILAGEMKNKKYNEPSIHTFVTPATADEINVEMLSKINSNEELLLIINFNGTLLGVNRNDMSNGVKKLIANARYNRIEMIVTDDNPEQAFDNMKKMGLGAIFEFSNTEQVRKDGSEWRNHHLEFFHVGRFCSVRWPDEISYQRKAFAPLFVLGMKKIASIKRVIFIDNDPMSHRLFNEDKSNIFSSDVIVEQFFLKN